MPEIQIDQERCKGCDLRLNLCPKQVLDSGCKFFAADPITPLNEQSILSFDSSGDNVYPISATRILDLDLFRIYLCIG
jgi:hypothetical protein